MKKNLLCSLWKKLFHFTYRNYNRSKFTLELLSNYTDFIVYTKMFIPRYCRDKS